MKKKHPKKSSKKAHSTKKGKETKREESYEGKTMMASSKPGSYSKRMLAMAKGRKG